MITRWALFFMLIGCHDFVVHTEPGTVGLDHAVVTECTTDENGGHTLAILVAQGSPTHACDEDIPTDQAVFVGDCASAANAIANDCDAGAIVGFGFRSSLVAGFIRDDPSEATVPTGTAYMTRCSGGAWADNVYNAGADGSISLTNEPGSEEAHVDIDVGGLRASFDAAYCPPLR